MMAFKAMILIGLQVEPKFFYAVLLCHMFQCSGLVTLKEGNVNFQSHLAFIWIKVSGLVKNQGHQIEIWELIKG